MDMNLGGCYSTHEPLTWGRWRTGRRMENGRTCSRAVTAGGRVTVGQSFRASHREGRLQAPQASGHRDPVTQPIN